MTFACALSSNASADPLDPLTYSTPGVVGTFDGMLADSNPSTELAIAQHILDLVGLGVESPAACTQCYRTSEVLDYSATLSNPVQVLGAVYEVSPGPDYVIAKYDGPNGGYVLFYLPTFGHELPQYPHSFWATKPEQYKISHFTTFDSVPDGGSTVALLGSALFAVGFLRRRFSKGRQS